MIKKLFDKLGFVPKSVVKTKEEQIADLMNTYIKPIDHQKWSKAVRKNKVCDCCSSSEKLTAHHLWPKTKYPNLALEVDNGVPLCETCHNNYHKWWMDVDNTSPVTYEYFKSIHQAKKSQSAYNIHLDTYKNKTRKEAICTKTN